LRRAVRQRHAISQSKVAKGFGLLGKVFGLRFGAREV